MIKSLYIKNFILIDEAKIEFKEGFNVLCGETGAGKSVIIKALDIVLGQKASKELAFDKTKPILIEAEFSDCTISRTIENSSKFRLNGLLSSLDEIKELRKNLVDIHSQFDTYSYLSSKHHINLLDNYIKILNPEYDELLKTYRETFLEFKETKNKLEYLKKNLADNSKELDFLKFQFNEINDADIKEFEEEEIKKELEVLSNVQELKETSYAGYWALYGDNENLIEALGKIKYSISNIANLDENLKEIESLIFDSYENLKEAANELESYSSNLNCDPGRLDELNERISLIQKLKRKYGSDLISEKEKIEKRIIELSSDDNNIEKLEENYNNLLSSINLMAQKIEDYRKNNSKDLSKNIVEKLKTLELSEAKFEIDIKETSINDLGKNSVEFLISTNKNQTPSALNKIASGGELSRVMLALKTIFSTNDDISTVVFDEIDTGISGSASGAVANSIYELSKKIQIISITHQPIIAAKADNFIWLEKTHTNKTNVKIQSLDSKKRLEALAKLVSGEVNQTAIDFAKTLI